MKQITPTIFHDRLFTDFYLCFLDFSPCSIGQAYGSMASCHKIFLTLSGQGHIQTGNSSYHLKAGQWLLLPPAISVGCRPSSEKNRDYLIAGFAGNRVSQVLSSVGLGDCGIVFSHADCSLINDLAKQLLSAPSSLYGILLRQSIVCQILAAFASSCAFAPAATTGSNPYISRSISYISRHYREHLSVQALADSLGITRNYLFTLFKQELGCSPHEYILGFRLKRACGLLEQTEYSIKDIAISCGYQDPVVFSKAFTRYYGQSPAAYRKAIHLHIS